MLNLKYTKKLFMGVAIATMLTTTANAGESSVTKATESSFTNAIKSHMATTTESIMANAIRTSDLSVESIAASPDGSIWVKFDNDFKKDTCSNKLGFRFIVREDKGNVFRALSSAQVMNQKVQTMYKPSVAPDANSTDCKLAEIMLVITK